MLQNQKPGRRLVRYATDEYANVAYEDTMAIQERYPELEFVASKS